MLTSRGLWFLVIVLVLLVLGLLGHQATLPVVALTLLLWFLGEGLLFAVRARLVAPRLVLERELLDERGPVKTLWAGRTFEVRVRLRLNHGPGLPHVAVADWVPFGLEHAGGATGADASLAPDRPLELSYRVRCPAVAGPARFEGLRVQLADLQGFFVHVRFVPGVVVYRVLPVLADARGHAPTSKRHNLLPPPGVHRLRRPGSGSELLDLRDYLPGDPPKTIAWKVSARRDRLITKEFESEVPLRCTLFVDTSNAVRVGPPGGNALGRLLHVSAAVAQANAAARDLTGLCLFDDTGVSVLRPARTARHLAAVMGRLADAAQLAPSTARAPVEQLLPLAHGFCQEVYPHLLRPEVNQVPFWLPWLWAAPASRTWMPATPSDRLRRWLVGVLWLLPLGGGLLILAALLDAAADSWPEAVPVPPEGAFVVLALALVLAYPALKVVLRALGGVVLGAVLGGLLCGLAVAVPAGSVAGLEGALLSGALGITAGAFLGGLLGGMWGAGRRHLARWRKQVAAVLAARYALGPGGLARLLEDDEECSLTLQRFLAEHQVPYALPLYDREGRYLFAAPDKVGVLARALLAAVGKGRDNELFVLLADLLELDEALAPLLQAVRVALARHHQVVVVCPWPPGVPFTEGETPAAGPAEERPGPDPRRSPLLPLLDRAARERFQAAYRRLRQAFARMGVPMVCAATDEPVPLILERLQQLRLAGRRR
jgi:uncharacterized protein (DUF58 family)